MMFFSRSFYQCNDYFSRMPFFNHMGFNLFDIVLWILLFAAVVLLVILLVTRHSRSHSVPKTTTSNQAALDALKLKYANGEIDEEEYLKRKRILTEE